MVLEEYCERRMIVGEDWRERAFKSPCLIYAVRQRLSGRLTFLALSRRDSVNPLFSVQFWAMGQNTVEQRCLSSQNMPVFQPSFQPDSPREAYPFESSPTTAGRQKGSLYGAILQGKERGDHGDGNCAAILVGNHPTKEDPLPKLENCAKPSFLPILTTFPVLILYE